MVESKTEYSCKQRGLNLANKPPPGSLPKKSFPGQKQVQGGLGQKYGGLGRTKDLEPKESLS